MQQDTHLSRWPMATVIVGMLVFALQMVTVLNPHMVEYNPEESVNAGQALAAAEGLWPYFLRLQYVDFCGGCTVDALIGAGVFAFLPPTWLAWKVVPALWAMAFTVVGATLLHRTAGRPASVAFLLVMLAPLDAWQRLSVYGLGNHMECAVLGVVVLLVLGPAPDWKRATVAGLMAGLAVWVGYSAAFILGVGTVWLILTRRWRPLAGWASGVALGLTALLHRASFIGRHRIRTLYDPAAFRPDPDRLSRKLEHLTDPALLLSIVGASSEGAWWWSAASATCMAGMVLWAVWKGPPLARLLALALLGWVAAYGLVDFSLDSVTWGQRATPLGLRYAAPSMTVLMVLVSVVVGALWSQGRRVRAATALLIALGPGLTTRVTALSGARSRAEYAGLHAVDRELWRDILSERLSPAELETIARTTSENAAPAAWSLGRHAAGRGPFHPPAGQERAWAAGLGMGHRDLGSPTPGPAADHVAALGTDLEATGAGPEVVAAAHRSFWQYWLQSFGEPASLPAAGPARDGLDWVHGMTLGQAIGGCWGPVETDMVAMLERETDRRDALPSAAWLEGLGFGVGTICGPDPMVTRALQTGFHGSVEVGIGFDAGVRGRWAVAPSWTGSE